MNQLCMVCGRNESVVSVWRLWLRQLVHSAECIDCYDHMNARLGPSPKPVVWFPVADVAQTASSGCKVVDILTRKEKVL